MSRSPNEDPAVTLSHVGGTASYFEARGVEVRVISGPGTGITAATSSARFAIGSHSSCDLVLDDATVSRFHCELLLGDADVRVRDTASRNGTYVNGIRVTDAFLPAKSELQLGRSVIEVTYAGRHAAIPMSERTSMGGMIGHSRTMRAVFDVLEKAAPSDVTVLLEGETGTGKSLAARTLHELGPRASKPFLVLDCGAVPENLLEAELFGHVKGAFTGADTARPGVFEEAAGGTVFLDELGELPLRLQPKLLGVLQERTVRPVGSARSRPVDVRVIAATNRDLRAEVNSGRFRGDLYYRLAVITVMMPALRDRADDIPAIARRVLTSLGAGPDQMARLVDGDGGARLVQAPWPGNVRELRNYLERCLVLDEALPVPSDMPGHSASPHVEDFGDLSFADAKDRAIREFEQRYLAQLLERHPRVADAATAAGIDRTYFYRLLRRHGLKRPRG